MMLICLDLEVQHNETLSFKELLSLGKEGMIEQNQRDSREEILSKRNPNSKNKNKNQNQLSLGERQVVRSLYQRSTVSFKFQQDTHLKGKKHERSMLFSIMSFDEKMSTCQNVLKMCIEDKSIIVKNLSSDEIDIDQLFKEGCQLRQKREELKAMLLELINLNSSSSQLEEVCEFFDKTINFDCSLAKNLKKKKDREGDCNNNKSRQIYLVMQKFYSADSAVAFVSLMNDPGKIVKASQNFSFVVPNFYQRENHIVGSHINCMIPQQLHVSHNAILSEFGQHEVMQRALRDIPLVIGADKNGWSVAYDLKIQTYHDLQKQELGICAWIRSNSLTAQLTHVAFESQFISADLLNNGKIINISQQFFQQILNKNFHQRDIQSISLFSMIPALQGILKNYNLECVQNNHSNLVGEIYETLLVQIPPSHKQTNWMQAPHRSKLIESISQKHLYWIQMEVNVIKNKYMHILQLQIKNMRHLQVHPNDCNNSIDNGYSLYYKIEGLKSLCLQLMTLCDWTQEEIAPQFLDLTYEESSPLYKQNSINKEQRMHFINKQLTSQENKSPTCNQIFSNSQLQNLKTLSFGERSVNYEKDYEIIHLKEVKNLKDDEENQIIQNLTGYHYANSMSMLSPVQNNQNTFRAQSYLDPLNSTKHFNNNDDSHMNTSCHNINNFVSTQRLEQEDKCTANNISHNVSHTQLDTDQRQIQQQLQKNNVIQNLLSPSNLDISPINNQNSQYVSFTNAINKQGEGILKSTTSFQAGIQYGKSSSGDKNSSINIYSKGQYSPDQKIVKLYPAYNKQQSQRQNVEVDLEGSVNSSNKTDHSSLKREMIQKIKSEKKMIVLKSINLIGIIAIFALFSLNMYNFFKLNSSLKSQKTAFHLIDWCDQIRLSLAYSLSDMYLLNLMSLKTIIKFDPAKKLQQAQEYKGFALNRLNNSYVSYKNLIETFSSQDKEQIEIFNTILNTPINLTLFNTNVTYYNITKSLGYGLITLTGHIAKYATLNDPTNIHMINSNNNYESMIYLLQQLQDQTSSSFNSMLTDILQTQIYQMIYVFITTFVFSLSVLPTYSFIQIKREEILKLFSTISPDKLKLMMTNLLQSRARISEMLSQSGQSQSPTNKNQLHTNQDDSSKKKKTLKFLGSTGLTHNDDIIFMSQTQIQKKKNISSVTQISKFSFKILCWVLLFLIIMQIYSTTILFFVFNFKKNSHDNRKIMTSLTQTKSHTSAFYAMNQVCIIAKLMPKLTPPPSERYFNRAFFLQGLTSQYLNDLYDSQKNIHSYDKYGQSDFDSFLSVLLEKNACEAINNNLKYSQGTQFNYDECKSIQKGELNEGLINAVKAIFIQLEQQVDLYRIKDVAVFNDQLNVFQASNNLYIMDKFRNQIDSVIESSLNFMYDMSDRLFDYMISTNLILIILQSFAVVIVIFLGWFRYYSKIQDQLQQTKNILDLFEISILMDNSYIVSYFKKSL